MTWLWMPITIAAAVFQTARNAAQRGLVKSAGTLGATLVRFLYGLPFTALWLGILHLCMDAPMGGAAPMFSPAFFGWITMGGIAQLGATALLLMAMESRSFAVAVAYSKTEVLQVGLFGWVLLGDALGAASLVAIGLSATGVIMMSLKPGAAGAPAGSIWSEWFSPAALYGVAAGGLFGLSAIGYRGAALLHPDWSPFYSGPFNLLWTQAIQSLLLGGWLLARNRAALVAVTREWRLSVSAGFLGATASVGWFTAFAMRNAADVRALSLVEVLFGWFISRRVFKEKVARMELAGMGVLLVGLVVLILGA